MSQEHTNENGERVIAGSRRPDGTYRKDVRVRAGYTPQDEQVVYQSKGALFRQGVPKVPGMDDADLLATKAASKTKAARKNEKRKQKKAVEVPEPLDTVAAVTVQFDSTRLDGGGSSQSASTRISSGGQEPAESCLSPIEKKIRTLRKKLKQAEALIAKQQGGEPLTGPEKEKVQKAPAWESEIRDLEQM